MPTQTVYSRQIKITNAKNITPRTSVILEITFSDPLSLTFANKFNPPLPVKAPEIPSDLPLCNNVRMTISAETIINNALSIPKSSFRYIREVL